MHTEDAVPVNRLAPVTLRVREAVNRVIDSGWFVLGPEVTSFEQEFAAFCGASHCVGVASGTDALEIAMRAVGVSRGSQVVLAPNAGGYASTAARAIGATPRYADVGLDSHCLTIQTIEAAVTGLTSAVVITHLFGRVAPDTQEISEWASERGIAVIEDCAQSAGASIGGRMAGTFSDIATYSFYPTKNLAALGDGGAVMTSRLDLADRARALRQYGWSSRYRIETAGGRNSRLDELQAAVLRARLPDLAAGNSRRQEILARYAASMPSRVGRFCKAIGSEHVAHLAVATLEVDRDDFRALLAGVGVTTDTHYPILDFQQPVAISSEEKDAEAHQRCPNALWLNSRIVTVPCFPDMSVKEVDRVCDAMAVAGRQLA